MAQLTNIQQDTIYDLLIDSGVSYESLQLDLLDHICCMVEVKMDNGLDFSQSLTLSIQEFGLSNLAEIQEATIYLLTLKLNKMKKVIGITGILAAFSVIAGIVFKVNHWPGAGILLFSGLVLVCFIVFPSMAYFDAKKAQGWQKFAPIAGYSAGILLSLATLFRIMHWPGFFELYYPGLFLLVIVFLPMYTFKNYKTAENKIMAFSKSALILAGVAVMWGLFPILYHHAKIHGGDNGKAEKTEQIQTEQIQVEQANQIENNN